MATSKLKNELHVIEDCSGCGVCCLHMGYPAYMLPREPIAENELDREYAKDLLSRGWTHEELMRGHEGESHWHRLPEELKSQWNDFVRSYRRPGELDGPCFWFDIETRLCKHHEFRPQVCRDFEAGSVECKQWRREYRHLVDSSSDSSQLET